MFRNIFNPKILVVVLIALLCFFLPEVKAQALTDTSIVISAPVFRFTLIERLNIGGVVYISWKDGIIDVTYTDSSKVTGAAQIFFDWMKQ